MPAGTRIVGDMTNIGEQAKPPFAVLPDPAQMFELRRDRLKALATGHKLSPYLEFIAEIAATQHALTALLPAAALPAADRRAQSLAHGMPPLARAQLELDATVLATVEQLATHLAEAPISADALAIVIALRDAPPAERQDLIAAVLKGEIDPEDLARSVLVHAALQVHFARLAAMLDAEDLKPVANAACPTCGSPPMASTVVGWPRAYNTRYCTCGLCGTMWNVVRVTCVLCGSTDGVTFRSIDGEPDTVRAETCDKCRSYVKIVYQVKDSALEPLSDDIASVGLDMLLAEEGWKRGGQNPFLLGY